MRKLNFLAIAAVASFCVSCSAPVDYKVEDYRTTMQFHDNFKVMQLADLHLGVQGDTVGQLNFIETLIKHANPDLIVLTGDQFMLANTVIVNKLFERLNITCIRVNTLLNDILLPTFSVQSILYRLVCIITMKMSEKGSFMLIF